MKVLKSCLLCLVFILILPITILSKEKITDYTYRMGNGIKVNTEHGWNYVWVEQKVDSLDDKEESGLILRFIDIGDLISDGAEVEILSTAGDTLYTLEKKRDYYELPAGVNEIFCKLPFQEGGGFVSFNVSDIKVKKDMKTIVYIYINDVQVLIEEKDEERKGLGTIRTISLPNRNAGERGPEAYPTIYKPDNHSERVEPIESPNDVTHRFEPGFYDVLVKVDISWAGYKYKVWLENVKVEENVYKLFKLNLNSSKIKVDCEENCPDLIHFYPRGTADRLGLKEDKSMEIYSIEAPKSACICPPGVYDILLNYGYGSKYEWRKGVNCKYGELTILEGK